MSPADQAAMRLENERLRAVAEAARWVASERRKNLVNFTALEKLIDAVAALDAPEATPSATAERTAMEIIMSHGHRCIECAKYRECDKRGLPGPHLWTCFVSPQPAQPEARTCQTCYDYDGDGWCNSYECDVEPTPDDSPCKAWRPAPKPSPSPAGEQDAQPVTDAAKLRIERDELRRQLAEVQAINEGKGRLIAAQRGVSESHAAQLSAQAQRIERLEGLLRDIERSVYDDCEECERAAEKARAALAEEGKP